MNGMSRPWAAVLVTSLAANLFVLGFVVANSVRAAPQAGTATAVRPPPAPPAQAQVQRMVQGNAKALRPAQLAVRKANEAITKALMAEPFDAAPLVAALDELRAATLNSQQAVHNAMLDAVKGMSPEQRTQFAEASRRSQAERVFLGR